LKSAYGLLARMPNAGFGEVIFHWLMIALV
jgi:hypothetical protein